MRRSKVLLLKWLSNEQGQTLVMTVFCMGVLLGALGLAVDVGVLLHTRRQMQSAADAAAMAGATEMFYNGSTNVDARAKAAAKANGVDSDVSGNTVTINAGAAAGLQTGMTFTIYHKGKEIKDPSTGEVLDVQVAPLGQLTITTVRDKIAMGTFSGSGTPVVGDVVRK